MEIMIDYEGHHIGAFVRKNVETQRWETLIQVVWEDFSDSHAEWFNSPDTYETEEEAMREGVLVGRGWIRAGKPSLN